jgi:transcription-repair coupling factor (superfamily II helicase)
MQGFAERGFDVLLSTTIVESGLDVPSANTMVVHDAHRLGLAQLYQLRGRVGRAATQAFAYLTVPPDRDIGEPARRRLEVLQSLDTVGAGFGLASHDMEIRGAGNLVGEEQSGHIDEIGFDLFQTMLERAVAAIRIGEHRDWSDIWVPRLALGIEARIPVRYVGDEADRLDLYWRLGRALRAEAIDEIEAEVTSRFGPWPPPVGHALDLARLRARCLDANIAEVLAGPKGAVLARRSGAWRREDAVRIAGAGPARMKRDGRLAVRASWPDARSRLSGVAGLLDALAAR